MYGTVETSRAANDAQTRYKPGPGETVNPSGTVLLVATSVSSKLLIDSAFLRAAVQMAAPMSRKRLLRMANVVEARKVTVCLATPLREGRKANRLERIRGWRKGGETHVNKAKAANTVPRRISQYPACVEEPRELLLMLLLRGMKVLV
jgi:hypothetical protein